ncbi:MAG TPA: hypothetical protein VFR93_07605 [Candidatus Limnocylindrales bacterium]|jgi:hypothetical protein|nr:hypothetical protein [Candidatus Limnocylindrales bacterium]
MNDDRSANSQSRDRTVIPEGAEPSLAVRIARSDDDLVDGIRGEPNPVTDDDERGLDEQVREGDQRAPRGPRVDAAAATFGEDETRDDIAEGAGGRAQGSVGGGMVDDIDRG